MEMADIYNELDNFYEIRGDTTGKKYVLEFLRIVDSEDVPVDDYPDWFDSNVNELGRRFKINTRYTYRSILKQFIRYLLVVDDVKVHKSLSKKCVDKKSVPESMPRHGGTRIYDNFYEFNNSRK